MNTKELIEAANWVLKFPEHHGPEAAAMLARHVRDLYDELPITFEWLTETGWQADSEVGWVYGRCEVWTDGLDAWWNFIGDSLQMRIQTRGQLRRLLSLCEPKQAGGGA